jgi:tetratricopeptide (TPR) repeat protein
MKTRLLFVLLIITATLSACKSCSKKEKKTKIDKESNNIQQLKNEIQKDTNNALNYFFLGKAYADIDSFDLALTQMLKAISKKPRDPKLYSGLSNMFLKFNKSYESIDILKKYLSLVNPNDVNILSQLGVHYLYVKKYHESIEIFNQILKLNPSNADAYFYKALNYDELGEFNKAVSTLQTAVEQNSNHIASYLKLGNMYYLKNDEKCMLYYNNALRIDSLNAEAMYGIAMYLQDNNKKKDALQWYRKIIMNEPQNFDAHFNTGYIYYISDSLPKAERSFDRAIQIEPASSVAYTYRGLTRLKMKKNNEARKDLNQALIFDKDNEEARKGLDVLDKTSK